MWDDINKVSLFEEIPDNIFIFKRVANCLKASRYFLYIDPVETWNLKDSDVLVGWSWIITASLNSLFSIKDMIKRDCIEHRLLEKWNDSIQKKEITIDPLLSVLREIRNYNIHIEYRNETIENFTAFHGSSIDDNKLKDFGEYIFFKEVNIRDLLSLSNVKRGFINTRMLDWFNRQTRIWPVHFIIGEARQRYALYVSSFLATKN